MTHPPAPHAPFPDGLTLHPALKVLVFASDGGLPLQQPLDALKHAQWHRDGKSLPLKMPAAIDVFGHAQSYHSVNENQAIYVDTPYHEQLYHTTK
jgi:hypothetical protein